MIIIVYICIKIHVQITIHNVGRDILKLTGYLMCRILRIVDSTNN